MKNTLLLVSFIVFLFSGQEKEIALEDIDGEIFEDLGDGYVRDEENIYYKGKKVRGSDQDTFQSLGKGYAKDVNNIYSMGRVSDGIYLEEFRKYSENELCENGICVKDKYSISHGWGMILGIPEGIDITPLSDRSHLGQYIKSENYIYRAFSCGKFFHYEAVDGIDIDSVGFFGPERYMGKKPIINEYLFDDENVFFCSCFQKGACVRIEGVDLGTFKILSPEFYGNRYSLYSQDKNFIYYGGEKVEGLDKKTFEVLDLYYFRDKSSVYYQGKKIEGLDEGTFKILKNGYVRDKNFAYYYGKKIGGSDGPTFRGLSRQEVEDVDYAYDAEDKNYKYKTGKIIKRSKFFNKK